MSYDVFLQRFRDGEATPVESPGRAIYHLMFEVAVAGDMTIMPPDLGPFVVREEQLKHLPIDLRSYASLVRSGEELSRAIEEA